MKQFIPIVTATIILAVLGPSLVRLGSQSPAPSSTNSVPKTPNDQSAVRPKTDLEKLQGIWWLEFGNHREARIHRGPMALAIDNKRASFIFEDDEVDGGIYLDPTTSPKSLDFATHRLTRECIYSLEGDVLILSYDNSDEAARPTNFEIPRKKVGQPFSHQFVMVFRRIVPAEVFPMRRPDGSRFLPKMTPSLS